MAGEPATEQRVDAADAAVDGGQDGHEPRIACIIGDALVQHEQRHRHDRAGDTLDHAPHHEHRHVDGERRDAAADAGEREHADEHLLAPRKVAQARQEQ